MRAMALDMISKMVKASGPAQIQPHLADLSVTMLESLSGMEVCTTWPVLTNFPNAVQEYRGTSSVIRVALPVVIAIA